MSVLVTVHLPEACYLNLCHAYQTDRGMTRINDWTRKPLAGNQRILGLQSGVIKKGQNWTLQDTLIKSSATCLSLVTMH